MNYEIIINKQECKAIVLMEMQKRILAKEPKQRVGNENVLEILKKERPELKILGFIKTGYCSNIDGEPNRCIWELQIEKTWDDSLQKEKKNKNLQKLEIKEKNEDQLDNPTEQPRTNPNKET